MAPRAGGLGVLTPCMHVLFVCRAIEAAAAERASRLSRATAQGRKSSVLALEEARSQALQSLGVQRRASTMLPRRVSRDDRRRESAPSNNLRSMPIHTQAAPRVRFPRGRVAQHAPDHIPRYLLRPLPLRGRRRLPA